MSSDRLPYIRHARIGNHFCVTHGYSRSRLYQIWRAVKKRCSLASHPHYWDYGGRGIHVCAAWLSGFEPFKEWALSHGYASNLSIDRIDGNGNYEPSNCRWSTALEQSHNRRDNMNLTVMGRTMTLREWARYTGMNRSTIQQRIKLGWSPERALTTPGVANKCVLDVASLC